MSVDGPPTAHPWPSRLAELGDTRVSPCLPRTYRTDQAIHDLQIADVDADIWPDHQLAEQKLTPWQMVYAGFDCRCPQRASSSNGSAPSCRPKRPEAPPTHER